MHKGNTHELAIINQWQYSVQNELIKEHLSAQFDNKNHLWKKGIASNRAANALSVEMRENASIIK